MLNWLKRLFSRDEVYDVTVQFDHNGTLKETTARVYLSGEARNMTSRRLVRELMIQLFMQRGVAAVGMKITNVVEVDR